jgi:hypothetical protein
MLNRVKHLRAINAPVANETSVLIGGGPGSAFEPYKSVKYIQKEHNRSFHNVGTLFKCNKVRCCLIS